MLLFIAGMVAITFLLCCVESYCERDWPRSLFKYFAVSVLCLIGWLFLAVTH